MIRVTKKLESNIPKKCVNSVIRDLSAKKIKVKLNKDIALTFGLSVFFLREMESTLLYNLIQRAKLGNQKCSKCMSLTI